MLFQPQKERNKTCHDTLKSTLNSLHRYSSLLSEVEPYGVFGDLVPQLPLNRVQARQARDPLTPDIRVDLPSGAGTTQRTYIEIKTCSGTSKWYRNPRERAVERRVDSVLTEYARHAREADLRHHGVEQGPISQRLASMALSGMAFGMMGEASISVHQTIQVMAEARVAQQNLERFPLLTSRASEGGAGAVRIDTLALNLSKRH